MFKYFGEQDDGEHGGRLFWSNHLEAPYRGGQAPLLTRDEFDKLEVNYDAHVATFDLSDPEQLQKYQAILDRAANGNWYVVHHVERHWDAETKTMKVYIEWMQKYSALPPNAQQTGGITL